MGGRCPVLVPMPSSPRRRAPASVSSVSQQVLLAALGARVDDHAVLEAQLDAGDVHAAGLDGIVKCTVPLADVSCGPVKTSPDGMLRLPSELTQVRPSTCRASARCPAPRCGSPGVRQRLDQPRLAVAQRAPGGDRVRLVEEQRALDQRRRRRPCPSPPAARARASATASRSSGGARRARAARSAHAWRAARRAGSTSASALALVGAMIRTVASVVSASRRSSGAELAFARTTLLVERRRAAAAMRVARAGSRAGGRPSAARPRRRRRPRPAGRAARPGSSRRAARRGARSGS